MSSSRGRKIVEMALDLNNNNSPQCIEKEEETSSHHECLKWSNDTDHFDRTDQNDPTPVKKRCNQNPARRRLDFEETVLKDKHSGDLGGEKDSVTRAVSKIATGQNAAIDHAAGQNLIPGPSNSSVDSSAKTNSNYTLYQEGADQIISAAELITVTGDFPSTESKSTNADDISIQKELVFDFSSDIPGFDNFFFSLPLNDNEDANTVEMGNDDNPLQPVIPSGGSISASERGRRKRIERPRDTSAKQRTRNPAMWKCNIAKKARDSGAPHTSVHGKKNEARKMGLACPKSCRNKCTDKINEEQRKGIFECFWGIADHNRQWDFIARHTKITEKQKDTTHWKSRRNFSRYHFFRIDGNEIKVCKNMFLNTLGICDSWTNTAARKLGSGGTVSPDKRGRHDKHGNRVSQATKDSAWEHINCFPRIPSHYCRKESNKEYLEDGLNVRKMYNLYVKWYAEQEYDPDKIASERQYRTIFLTKFNIAFHKPKKDQCDQCTAWRNAEKYPEQREAMKDQYETHIANKIAARKIKDADKEEASEKGSTINLACFDLEKVLNSPQGQASDFYYKTKISVYNFTVFDVGNRLGQCYLWHEATGNRGSNEVGSFLFDYIQQYAEKGVTEFRFYCDNCAGQNKNRYVYALLRLAAVKFNVKITVTFLEVGHTQTEGDSMHAAIERKARNKDIYTPDEWATLIKLAKAGDKPYKVHEVSQQQIYDLKPLVDNKTWDKNEEGVVIAWKKIRRVHVDCTLPAEIRYSYNYTGEFSTLSTHGRGRPVNLRNLQLQPAYTKQLPVNERTLKGLQTLCKKNLVPKNRHAFYKNLCIDNNVPWTVPE